MAWVLPQQQLPRSCSVAGRSSFFQSGVLMRLWPQQAQVLLMQSLHPSLLEQLIAPWCCPNHPARQRLNDQHTLLCSHMCVDNSICIVALMTALICSPKNLI